MKIQRVISLLPVFAMALPTGLLSAQAPPVPVVGPPPVTLQINLGQPGAHVSPTLYGLMTEEINHAYDGGLYAELIQNRSFNDDPTTPVHWSLFKGSDDDKGSIALDTTQPLNAANPVSLKLTRTGGRTFVGAANDSY